MHELGLVTHVVRAIEEIGKEEKLTEVEGMEKRLDAFILYFRKKNVSFGRFIDYIKLNKDIMK